MRWPWQRRRDEVEVDAPAPAPSRPRGQWRHLEPLHPAAASELSAAEPLGFVRTLSTRWQVPPALEPLGHEVSITAPPGRVPVAGAPVTGYPDPPELVWAAVAEAVGEERPAATSRRATARAEDPAPVRTERRSEPAAVTGDQAAAERLVVDHPGAPVPETVRDLVGDRKPLAVNRSRGPDVRLEPAAQAGAGRADEVQPLPDRSDLRPVRRAAPRQDADEDDRLVVRDVAVPGEVPRPRAAVSDEAVQERPRTPELPERAPDGAREAAPEVEDAVPAHPPALRAAPPVDRRLPVRPVVGRRPSLVGDRPLLRAPADPVDTPEPAGPRAVEPEPADDHAPAPGLGVPDWFRGGAVRPPLPEPDAHGPLAALPHVPRPEPGSGPAPSARRTPLARVPGTAAAHVAPRAADDALGPVASPGPRRVPWPLEGGVDEPDDDPAAPDETDEVVDDEPDDDAPGADGDRRLAPAAPDVVARAALRRPDDDLATTPSELRRTDRSDPPPAATRRFRVGQPLPRPASAPRAVQARSGLADLAVAAMAASAAPHDAPAESWRRDDPGGREGVADVGESRRALVPSDLGLPGVVDAQTAPTPVAPGRDDPDDELEDEPAPSADQLYEQVRVRLRHELMVDRERAALLAD